MSPARTITSMMAVMSPMVSAMMSAMPTVVSSVVSTMMSTIMSAIMSAVASAAASAAVSAVVPAMMSAMASMPRPPPQALVAAMAPSAPILLIPSPATPCRRASVDALCHGAFRLDASHVLQLILKVGHGFYELLELAAFRCVGAAGSLGLPLARRQLGGDATRQDQRPILAKEAAFAQAQATGRGAETAAELCSAAQHEALAAPRLVAGRSGVWSRGRLGGRGGRATVAADGLGDAGAGDHEKQGQPTERGRRHGRRGAEHRRSCTAKFRPECGAATRPNS
mmetsp:Transcript_37834/g.75394  ORF Transcript_37834/g.75394 Transcript_37834/m.75394 type:complete len:282 (+) Transcript_37834:475-1320(+)